MTDKYWFDTCIWRDFYENRFSRAGNPLGEYAANAFMKIFKKGNKIFYSESLIKELHKDYDQKDINEMLNLLYMCNILVKVEITKDEFLEAMELSEKRKLPFVDCLIAVHARNHNAVVVSQDQHFIKNLTDIVKVIKPQDI